MKLSEELFGAITGAVANLKSGKREERRVPYCCTAFVLPIVANKSRPAVMVEVRDLSRKGMGMEVDFPVRSGDRFAVRLVTRGDDPVLIECVVRRTYPVRPGCYAVGSDFVRVLKDTRAAAA